MALVLAGILALTAGTTSAQQQAPPDWENKALERTAPNVLIDADTHQPFVLTDAERAMIAHAMEVITHVEPTRKDAPLFQTGYARIKNGEPLTMGDVIFINGPLMMVQSLDNQASATNPNGMTESEIALIRPLLRRMRKAAAAMASTK